MDENSKQWPELPSIYPKVDPIDAAIRRDKIDHEERMKVLGGTSRLLDEGKPRDAMDMFRQLRNLSQKKFCGENGIPHFAPSDGICVSCRENIYSKITAQQASSTHITGCPHCFWSFCE